MKPIQIHFNKGIQFPPKLGTVILKPTVEGMMAYAQNIDTSNDEYGSGVIVPGPALTTIDNNSELSGVPFAKSFYGSSALAQGYVYFMQGILGTKTIIRRIKDVISGSTPTLDTGGIMTANHLNHTNQVLVDIITRSTITGDYIYVSGKDDNDTWVYKFSGNSLTPSLDLVATITNFTGGYTDVFFVLGTDNNILYWIGKNRIDSIDTSDTHNVNALANGLPLSTYASAGADWQGKMWIALSTDAFGDFDRRKSAGKASIVWWDYVSTSIETSPIPAPCRYISAVIPDPNGQLLVFGGVDEGKSSIYEFTGYGFRLLYSYIGDLPRSRHSVEFDGQGRIVFLTYDGQLCRFDRATGKFDHLATGSSSGGMLAKGIGAPVGNEFFTGTGVGSTYTLSKVQFGSYIGDDDADTDTTATPMAISGIQTLPQGSNIQAITLHLARTLLSNEKLELRIYKNGSTTYDVYMTMDGTDVNDLVSSKRVALTLDNINSFSLSVAWKQTNGLTTAPPVLMATAETGEQY